MKVRLGDVVSIVAKQADPRLPQFAGLPLINGENIESGTTRLLFRRTAASESAISGKYIVDPGDVVYSKLRPYLRKVVVAVEPGLCSADSYPLRPDLRVLDPQWLAWMLVSDRFTSYATDASARARMPKLNREQLFAYEFELPSTADQRLAVARLGEQLRHVTNARDLATDGWRLTTTLARKVLKEAFRGAANEWQRPRLTEIAETRRSPSVTSIGDADVRIITSGCLTPIGFSFDGIRVGRMSERDAAEGIVTADEVLVSRSNTEALVGRASRYPGGPRSVVASDLVFRLVPDPMLLSPDYLAGYLSALQLDGYWRDRSSGASSTMKKITKSLLLSVAIPLPPLAEQHRIVEELQARTAVVNDLEAAVRAEREAIAALPAVLLRRTFEDMAA
jgi:type I restriction enzyme, S subunit